MPRLDIPIKVAPGSDTFRVLAKVAEGLDKIEEFPAWLPIFVSFLIIRLLEFKERLFIDSIADNDGIFH